MTGIYTLMSKLSNKNIMIISATSYVDRKFTKPFVVISFLFVMLNHMSLQLGLLLTKLCGITDLIFATRNGFNINTLYNFSFYIVFELYI